MWDLRDFLMKLVFLKFLRFCPTCWYKSINRLDSTFCILFSSLVCLDIWAYSNIFSCSLNLIISIFLYFEATHRSVSTRQLLNIWAQIFSDFNNKYLSTVEMISETMKRKDSSAAARIICLFKQNVDNNIFCIESHINIEETTSKSNGITL